MFAREQVEHRLAAEVTSGSVEKKRGGHGRNFEIPLVVKSLDRLAKRVPLWRALAAGSSRFLKFIRRIFREHPLRVAGQSRKSKINQRQTMSVTLAIFLILLNGKPVQFTGVQPVKEQGRVMVPLRGVFEAMGAFVDYSVSTHTVTAVRNNRRVELQLGAKQATVNGVPVALETPATTRTGRVLVPLRFIAESLGANVFWDNAENTVRITTTNADGSEVIGSTPPRGGIRAGEIEMRATTDKKFYKSGEPVKITMTAINQDDRPRSLVFRNGQSFDVTITPKDADTPRWDWSHDRMFTMAIREVTLKPGETMEFSTTWKQQNNEGSEMPRGDYDVQVRLTTEEPVLAPVFSIRLIY
jgi:hypothetical protein